eukprot:354363-Amphidinium_carterae.1
MAALIIQKPTLTSIQTRWAKEEGMLCELASASHSASTGSCLLACFGCAELLQLCAGLAAGTPPGVASYSIAEQTGATFVAWFCGRCITVVCPASSKAAWRLIEVTECFRLDAAKCALATIC